MFKNVFSIPVYTKPEVIIDQLLNIHTFNPDAAIVLHFNPIFSWESDYIDSIEQFADIIDSLDYVFVNPERVRCGLFDVIGAHMSNFKFADKAIDFEYFTLTASNEMYCRAGRDDLLFDQSALTTHRKIDVKKSAWGQLEGVKEDNYYKELFPNMVDSDYIYCGYCEGNSYRRDIFAQMVEMIEAVYDHLNVPLLYAREEVYFPQALRMIANEDDLVYKRTTYMPWKKGLYVSCVDVCDIADGIKDYYAVKRVDLNILYSTRAFIRQYIGKYHNELEKLLGKEVKTYNTDELSKLDLDVTHLQEEAIKINLIKEFKGKSPWVYI